MIIFSIDSERLNTCAREGAIMARSKKTNTEIEEQQPVEDEYDTLIEDTDYGFIISSTGELKSFFCPDNFEGWPPKEIVRIFKIFKITDLSQVMPVSSTLH